MMKVLRTLGHAFARDAIDDVAAMLAYYSILSVFPLLLLAVTLAVLVLPQQLIAEGARLAIEAAPTMARPSVASHVETLTQHARLGFAVGTVIAVWSASRGASGLMLALNRLFRRVETRSWLRRQAIAIALTVGLAVLLVIALGLLVVGPMIGRFVADRLGLGSLFDLGWGVSRWLLAGLLVMVIWALVYKFLPDTDAPFRIFTPGAFIGVGLWLGISWLFELYLDHFGSYTSIYGTVGSTVILLTWLWLSSMSLLIGAEINVTLADLRSERTVTEQPRRRDLAVPIGRHV